MIAVANIVPTPHLNERFEDRYNMCLWQEVKDNKYYANFFRRQVIEGKFVIMDNGAAEGVNPSADELLPIYGLVNPHEIVLPDVVGNMEETINRTRDAYAIFQQQPSLDGTRFMAVPQGSDFNEWLECMNLFIKQPAIDTIGVSKFCTKNFQDELGVNTNVRLECVDAILKAAELLDRDIAIHLLGCWDNPKEIGEISQAFPGKVRGTDSAVAFVYTRNNELVTADNHRPDNKEIDFKNEYVEDEELLEENINRWNQLCNGLEIVEE